MDVERGVYNTNNQPKESKTFKYEQEGRLYIGVAKVEGKDGKIIGKRCPVFDYKEKKFFYDRCLQKRNEERIGNNKEAYFVLVTMGRKKLKPTRYGSVNL